MMCRHRLEQAHFSDIDGCWSQHYRRGFGSGVYVIESGHVYIESWYITMPAQLDMGVHPQICGTPSSRDSDYQIR
jgi:hypothetical protein